MQNMSRNYLHYLRWRRDQESEGGLGPLKRRSN